MKTEIQLDRGVSYERSEDMSPEGKLAIYFQDDGDIIVTCQGVSTYGEPERGSVEFCCTGAGGGRSPKTREALIALARAIVEDNGGLPSPNVKDEPQVGIAHAVGSSDQLGENDGGSGRDST